MSKWVSEIEHVPAFPFFSLFLNMFLRALNLLVNVLIDTRLVFFDPFTVSLDLEINAMSSQVSAPSNRSPVAQ